MTTFPYQKAAEALYRCDFEPVSIVAHDLGITTRTISNWKERLRNDEELAKIYNDMGKRRLATVTSRIPNTINDILAFITSSTKELDPADPESLKSITSSLSTLMEVLIILQRYPQ